MKLKNLIAPLRQKIDRAISWRRYNPLTKQGQKAIANSLGNKGKRRLENMEIASLQKPTVSTPDPRSQTVSPYRFPFPPNPYPQYDKCDRNNPLGCDRAFATLKNAPSAKFCSRCGFPIQLAQNKEIRGKKGIYQIKSFLKRQENGRIYTASNQNSGQALIIKEYLLPRRCFPEEIARQYKKEIFDSITNFQPAANLASDSRLIIPLEGIVDKNQNRCYLVTSGNLAALPSLKDHLQQQGKFEPAEVITLLDQVLQSLEFLHSQKWQYKTGAVKQGFVHGNLSLDSLLISQTEVGFFIYLWDFASWEDLFNPLSQEISTKQVVDDLRALGNIGLYLLAVPEIIAKASYPLNPRNENNWQGINPQLKSFLLKLMGLNSQFTTANAARKELRQIAQTITAITPIPAENLETPETEETTANWLILSLIALGLLLFGGIIWWRLSKKTEPTAAKSFTGTECIKDIRSDFSGNLNYGIVEQPSLKNIFITSQTYSNSCQNEINSNNFQDIISQLHQIDLQQKVFGDRDTLINSLDSRNNHLALIDLNPNQYGKKIISQNSEIINETIAYNGLLVYVPFDGCQGNCGELGNYLEQKITIQQLKDIYLGKISYWSEINPNIPQNLKITAFAPQNSFALEQFEQLLLNNNPEDIAAFREAIASGKIQQQETYSMLDTMRVLWEQEAAPDGTKQGAIGFHLKDKVYKQCNVYPLAVVKPNSVTFPMLVTKDGAGVDLFKSLSCKYNKQDYQLNEAVFRDRSYPLAFSLNLLYLNSNENDNAKMGATITDILKTQEFQCHLSHKKFIPLELSEKDCKR